ncbi:MAG: DUF1801 domain-containing protein [Thermoanaerobaculia bacterium]
MAENKTKQTEENFESYIAGIADEARRADCRVLVEMMTKATKAPPKMWGTGIVGFGSYHYKYASGREGDSCILGFSSRKGDISLYLVAVFPGSEALFAQLGKHKRAKACTYLKRLIDVDLEVLAKILVGSVAARKRNHAC